MSTFPVSAATTTCSVAIRMCRTSIVECRSISNQKRSLSMEKVEREVAKARSLIVDRELRNGKASRKEKEARVLSRAAERMERERIDNLEADLTLKGSLSRVLVIDIRFD